MGTCFDSIRWSRLSDPGMGDVDVSAEYPHYFLCSSTSSKLHII